MEFTAYVYPLLGLNGRRVGNLLPTRNKLNYRDKFAQKNVGNKLTYGDEFVKKTVGNELPTLLEIGQ